MLAKLQKTCHAGLDPKSCAGYWRWLPGSNTGLRERCCLINGDLPKPDPSANPADGIPYKNATGPSGQAPAYKSADQLKANAQRADEDLAKGSLCRA